MNQSAQTDQLTDYLKKIIENPVIDKNETDAALLQCSKMMAQDLTLHVQPFYASFLLMKNLWFQWRLDPKSHTSFGPPTQQPDSNNTILLSPQSQKNLFVYFDQFLEQYSRFEQVLLQFWFHDYQMILLKWKQPRVLLLYVDPLPSTRKTFEKACECENKPPDKICLVLTSVVNPI